MSLSALALTALLLTQPSTSSTNETLTLEQIMAEPDWVGAPVESPRWALDGKRVFYQLKQAGSPLRDTYELSLSGGEAHKLDIQDISRVDGANPVYDAKRQQAVFVRNGNVFLHNLQQQTLTPLTQTGQVTGQPLFSADNQHVLFRQGNDWYSVQIASPVMTSLARLLTEKDPNTASKTDAFRETQLETSQTLARRKANREALREQENAQRRANMPTVPAPIYLGDDVRLMYSALSPNRQWLLAVVQDKGRDAGQGGKMPVYVTESGYEELEDVRTRVGRNGPGAQKLLRITLNSGEITEIALEGLPGITTDPLADLRKKVGKEPLSGMRSVQISGIEFNGSGQQAAVMLRAVDNKDRWIVTLDASSTAPTPVHRLTDPGWINWNFNEFAWLPDQKTLWFLSEETGYSHLYTASANGRSKSKALTSGRWEASSPQLSADGRRFFFLCNREWPGDYEICSKPLASGVVQEITALDGVESFSLSPDGQSLLVSYSQSYLPTQLAVVPTAGGNARKLTDTRSDAFKQQTWLAPRFEPVPSRHVDAPIWSKFYRPETLEPGKKYPIVLFVHGAGYTQNTHARYPYYFREQMFHNLLVQQGYLVLDMDYRASEGYGRDWRTAIYHNFGKPELEDLIDGVQWLVENHQGDADRVGIYGGSYGGFMSLIAMFKAPDVFHAGAALRPVTDWSQYNHGYTSNILDTPDLNPEGYRDGSPIFFAEGLRGHLLIAHGMIDDNVFYQDSVRLAQRLIELKKENWELASYPLERHGFVEADAWLDEYRRIFKLFQQTLKPAQ